MNDVRVLTVDDQQVFLTAARALIDSTPGFALAGEARSGAEAILKIRDLHPDLVLMDVRMPGLDGLEAARRIADESPATVVVLVTGHDPNDVQTLAETGPAVEVVPKEQLRPRLLRRLWAAHAADRGGGAAATAVDPGVAP